MAQFSTELIKKYSRPGPRYTSYPTAAEFTNSFEVEEWNRNVEELAATPISPISIYAHIPFCHSLCYYCACNKIIPRNRSGVPAYLDSLRNEAMLYADRLGKSHVIDHIHWGGGTPNFLTPNEMASLHSSITESFGNITADTELSVEVDPRTLTAEHLKALRECGFNRISFGVQDFDREVQEAVNRIQSFEITELTVSTARKFGFAGINIDLIYGLPNQTLQGFSETVKQVIALNPDRIALYGYAHVTWVSKAQNTFRRFEVPAPDLRIAIFSEAVSQLTDAGYVYLGMDHFAKPHDELVAALSSGTLHRNFMGYTARLAEPLLGLGVSAISSLGGAIGQNSKEVTQYQNLVSQGQLPIVRGILKSREDRFRADIIERILCERQVDLFSINAKWGFDFQAIIQPLEDALSKFEQDGLISYQNGILTVTPLGAYFLRNIAMLFDTYLPLHEKADTPIFSQAV